MKKILLILGIFYCSACYAPKHPINTILQWERMEEAIETMQQEQLQMERISAIYEVILHIESSGNYLARGCSGEVGAFQFTKPTWEAYCLLFFGQVLDISIPIHQDMVALLKIQMFVDAGYSDAQIASLWNSGRPDWKGRIGVNHKGISYNVPAYVHNFLNLLLNT